jgi:electron transfer flavoprotein alpha subunit
MIMKIAVCIKQVPVISKISFDYESKTIVREGVPLEVNSFDLLAVDRAVALKDQIEAEVVVYTMGPPKAREALVQCLAMGADRAVHLKDLAMAGSDTLATARTLAFALQRDRFDLVFCGRNSTDSETGQVGPELAEILSIPHVSNVRMLEYTQETGNLVAERVTDDGYEVIKCPTPALVCVTEGIMKERWPNRQEMQAAANKPIMEITAAQLSAEPSLFGTAGSPTWVADIQLLEPHRSGVVIEGVEPETAVRQVIDEFKNRVPASTVTTDKQWNRYRGRIENSVWVIVEGVQGSLRHLTFELLGKARELAELTQSEVVALLVGPERDDQLRQLAAYGADRIIILDNLPLGHPIGTTYTEALAINVNRLNPYAILFPANSNGRDMASRLAARLGLGLTGDCVDLEINGNMELVQMKPALGGNVIAPILSKTKPYLTTLRPGLLNPILPDWTSKSTIETLPNLTETKGPDLEVIETHTEKDAQGSDLESARIVICAGKGVGGPDNLPIIYSLAKSIGAVVATTRDVAENGWLPRQIQVGLTGRVIAPEIYIAVGVRGDFNHMVGVQKAGTIIAINNNNNPRRTPMLHGADFTLIGDWQTYLPLLVEAIKPLVES